MLSALTLCFSQALIIGSYDATLAPELVSLFQFTAFQAGSMFLIAGLPGLLFGPMIGHAVDRITARPVAVAAGFSLAVALGLFRLMPVAVATSRTAGMVFFGAILFVNGASLAGLGTAGLVEAQNVVREQPVGNDDSSGLIRSVAPYGQLLGLTGCVFNAGLSIGAALSGTMRVGIGYENMNLVWGGFVAAVAIMAWAWVPSQRR